MSRVTPLDLKSRPVALVLAWLVPGLGHIYQGRITKGIAFMICVLGLFGFGCWFGKGQVVYHRWDDAEKRWSYVMQLGAGLPAFPALLDFFHCRTTISRIMPSLASLNARPLDERELRQFCVEMGVDQSGESAEMAKRLREKGIHSFASLAEVDDLHRRLGIQMDIALIYTMIAGLLNVLIIYDAAAGPAHYEEDLEEDRKKQLETSAT
jgi:hypothetical protein